MQGAFVTVVIAVGVIGVLGALVALLLSGRTWETLGRDRLLMESELDDPRGRVESRAGTHGRGEEAAAAIPTGSAHAAQLAERDTEIRQMLEAGNRRRRRQGRPELDVEAELARRVAGDGPPARATIDEALLAEIRELVIAGNRRRARRGEPPLDVDAEVERQIARLTG